MNPATLRFLDPQLEARYQRQNERGQAHSDQLLCGIHAAFALAHWAVQRSGGATPERFSATLLYLIAVVTHALLAWGLSQVSPRLYARWRMALMVLLLVALSTISALGLPAWSSVQEITSKSMLKSVILGSACLFNLWNVAVMPMSFGAYSLLLPIQVVFQMAYHSPRVCGIVSGSSVGQAQLRMVWQLLNQLMPVVGVHLASPLPEELVDMLPAEYTCRCVVTFAQVLLGLVVPLLLVYTSERSRRARFLHALGRPEPCALPSLLGLPPLLMGAFYFTAAVAIVVTVWTVVTLVIAIWTATTVAAGPQGVLK